MMKMKCVVPALLLLLAATARGETADDAKPAVPPELLEKPYLYEVARHLYAWYLDEVDIQKAVGAKTITFWVRGLNPELDPDDHSRMGEIVLPVLGVRVKVKKADYAIPELGAVVKADRFKITNVSRGMPADPEDYTPVEIDYADMKDYLFRTRADRQFPNDELVKRVRVAVGEKLADDIAENNYRDLPSEHVVNLSALSPVANELWIFWETGRLMIRISSDIDLANPAVWDQEELAVDAYDIDEQVVVSLDEVPGSNAFLTRDQVGRTLFNCIVMGKRLVLEPLPPPAPGN